MIGRTSRPLAIFHASLVRSPYDAILVGHMGQVECMQISLMSEKSEIISLIISQTFVPSVRHEEKL